MRIAQLAPIKRPINPSITAARPRVMFDLITELVKNGHEVTVFGTKDSDIPGTKTVGIIEKGLNFMQSTENPFYTHTAYLTVMIMELIKRQGEFDIIHNHMYPEFLPLLALSSIHTPIITTVHAQMTKELVMVLRYFPKTDLVAISEAAKKASSLPMNVIHNGVDTEFFVPTASPSMDYLLFVGRFSKAKDERGNFLDPKGVLHAITVAEKLEERLLIVGNVEDRSFYDTLIVPRLTERIRFVGEPSEEQVLSRQQVRNLYQHAKALLFPINWEEPFGLVMVEAMACGTPVIAFNRGAIPEVVVDGKTGFIVENVEQMVETVKNINMIDRSACRKHVEQNFTIERMVDEYEKLYQQVLGL